MLLLLFGEQDEDEAGVFVVVGVGVGVELVVPRSVLLVSGRLCRLTRCWWIIAACCCWSGCPKLARFGPTACCGSCTTIGSTLIPPPPLCMLGEQVDEAASVVVVGVGVGVGVGVELLAATAAAAATNRQFVSESVSGPQLMVIICCCCWLVVLLLLLVFELHNWICCCCCC